VGWVFKVHFGMFFGMFFVMFFGMGFDMVFDMDSYEEVQTKSQQKRSCISSHQMTRTLIGW
jgi:hypothetical protein